MPGKTGKKKPERDIGKVPCNEKGKIERNQGGMTAGSEGREGARLLSLGRTQATNE